LTSLHDILIAPVERSGVLRGTARLILVPHSVLSYLPFAALVQKGTGRRLMQDYALLLLPSAGALGIPGRARTALSAQTATAFAPFPGTLPGSVREVRAFRRATSRGRSVEGNRATESSVRRALMAGGIVHVASHGVLNPRNPMFSRIELANGRGGPGNDGRIEVHELLAMRVTASLVFLSGCETGVGTSWSTHFARGEDYATLGQAFLYAGARTVIATLWQINDEGAAVFAERFYVNLRSMPPAEALAATQRATLTDPRFASPYYWAAYQVLGANDNTRAHSDTAPSVTQD
jgi:CHAT domain-containing protein